jgi:hypothetical protein
VLDELIRQAAQGSVVHNDDTGMRILKLARDTDDGRTGTFTSGIVSIWREWKIALYFTGWKHAGENLADVLKQRAPRTRSADSDVRCVVAEHAEAAGRRNPAGQLSGARKAAVCRSRGELSRRMPVCAGVAGRGIRLRREAKELGLTPEERLSFIRRTARR